MLIHMVKSPAGTIEAVVAMPPGRLTTSKTLAKGSDMPQVHKSSDQPLSVYSVQEATLFLSSSVNSW